MSIKSNLEVNRAEELEKLLLLVKPIIIEHIEISDPTCSKYKSSSLGKYYEPRYLKSQLLVNDLNEGIKGNDIKLLEILNKVLKYSVNTWNPGFLDKLYASNNPIGVISDLILSVLNTNVHVYTVSPVLSIIENYIGNIYAKLFFEDNQETAGGLTFSGGSWSNITSMHIAKVLKFPETKEKGNCNYKFAIYTSEHCHYSIIKSAILLGIGSNNVFKIKVLKDGRMDIKDLINIIEKTKNQGFIPLYINATAGTTVFGSYDPLEEIAKISKQYNIWFHIDGSWGGNVIFSKIHKKKLDGCKYADSITVNPHKMLGIPNTCSFLLLPNIQHFQKSMSLNAPYLFHNRENDDNDENFDLADGTMGCGRRGDAFKFYLEWLYYGYKGFEERIDHAFEITKYFVTKIDQHKNFELVLGNKDNLPQSLQVCFYYKPDGYNKKDYTDVTKFISRELHKNGKYLMDFSPNPSKEDDRGEFFRVVFNSPILTDKIIDELISSIIETGNLLQLN